MSDLKNEFSIKPTLQVNRTQKLENIKGIAAKTLKIGTGAIVNIVNNPKNSEAQQVLLLQTENLNLLNSLVEIGKEISVLGEQYKYNEYRLLLPAKTILKFCDLLNNLDKKIDYNLIYDGIYQIFLVNVDDWNEFVKCASEFAKDNRDFM